MSTISAASVNELRKKTDQPLMDCKKALTEAGGDMDKAVLLLRSWNAKATVKRGGNETGEGRVGIFLDNTKQVAAILELRCESAPTAKNDRVLALVQDLTQVVADTKPTDVADLLTKPFAGAKANDRLEEVVGVIREKMIVQRFERLEGGTFGEYVHHDGTVGAIVQCTGTAKGETAEVLRDVCAHIAALNPEFLNPAAVPAEKLEKEKAFIAQQIKDDPKNASKPANIIEKMADGKIKSWLGETALTEQAMANGPKYPNTTVAQAIAKVGLTIQKFVRYKVGASA
jgi:elongation factor Ts